MKSRIFIYLFLIVFGGNLKAQVVSVCGTDTIILEVENYDVGLIEWQVSPDTVNWVSIPEENGTTYTFFPTETRYYRAVVKTTDCDLLCSAVSFIQIPPKAQAGSDRVVGGNSTNLMANSVDGAEGEWECISGSGSFEDFNNPGTKFSGNYDEENILVWKLTNSCGQSSDTVKIKFEEIQSKSNYIVVDNTDEIFSDSLDLINGILKVRFSDSGIFPKDSTILIGMRSDISFLLRTISYSVKNGIYTIQTENASLEDLFTQGTINIGDATNQSITGEAIKGANSFPTRSTLQKNSNNKGIKLLYETTLNNNGETVLKSAVEDGKTFKIPLPDAKIIETKNKEISLAFEDSYVSLTPNMVFDLDYQQPAKLTNIVFGVDNAVFEYNYNASFSIKAPIVLDSTEHKIVGLTKYLVFMAGPVPVVTTANFDVKADLLAEASVSAETMVNIVHRKNVTALVMGKSVDNLTLVTSFNEQTTENDEFVLQGKLKTELKLGIEVSCRLYDIVGPYLKVPFKATCEYCVNNKQSWDMVMKLGAEGSIGANAKILGNTFFDFKYDLFKLNFAKIEAPGKLELLSGNYQFAAPNTLLPQPLVFQVTASNGKPVNFVPVRFLLDDTQGTVDDSLVFTDYNGIATVNWTLGDNSLGVLKASVFDCDNKDIEGSPVFVYANTDEDRNCANSDLKILLDTNDGYLLPVASGGNTPYSYSLNGIDFSETIPIFDLSQPDVYTIHIMDVNGCRTSRSIVIDPENICLNSDLNLNAVLVQSNILNLKAEGGIPPYSYSVDNPESFSEISDYTNLEPGIHQVYLKDANGCIVEQSVKVEASETPALIAIKPAEESFVDVQNIAFEWAAGTYAETQYFDIFLKEDSNDYVQIAFDLSNNFKYDDNTSIYSFLASQSLDYGKHYTCKISLKDAFGVERASTEYSFYTISGMSVATPEPILLAPANNSVDSVLPITLKWQEIPGFFKYDIYVGTNPDSMQMLIFNYTSNEITLDNLLESTKYYWKIGIKSLETGETNESKIWNFAAIQNDLQQTDTVTDVDGNTYKTVKIGNQWWMAENLKVTKYADGTAIPLVENAEVWNKMSDEEKAYCFYGNSQEYKNQFGALYSWSAAMNGESGSDTNPSNVQGVCPTGWHLPANSEWTELVDFLGGNQIAGGKMKTTGLEYWLQPNVGATNESGFSALPAGYRVNSGQFQHLTLKAYFWSSSTNLSKAFYRSLWTNSKAIENPSGDKNLGFSVRCVKNAEPTASIPTVLTKEVINLAYNSATCLAEITSNGNNEVILRGIEYSKTSGFEKGSGIQILASENGNGTYSIDISGLSEETTYYVRAFATNSVGTAYGDELSFKTLKDGSIKITSVTPLTATLGQETIFTVTGSNLIYGMAYYISDLQELSEISGGSSTVRQFKGTPGYSAGIKTGVIKDYPGGNVLFEFEVEFILPDPDINFVSPLVATLGEETTFTVSGNNLIEGLSYNLVDLEGITEVAGGTSTSRQFKGTPSGSAGTKSGVIKDVPGENILFEFEVEFVENVPLPVVTIIQVSGTTYTSSNVTGRIASDGGASVTERGICWNTTGNPNKENDNHTSNGTGTGDFTGELTGLEPGTMYFIRAFATNSEGTAYSQQFDFNTIELPTPEITSVSPSVAMLGEETTFTVSGNNLVEGLFYDLADLEGITEVAGGTSTSRQFKGTPSGSAGTKSGTIKDAPGGNVLFEFEVEFIEKITLPEVSITQVSPTSTTATVTGNVLSDGGAEVTERGICWNTTGNPNKDDDNHTSNGTGTGEFIGELTELLPNTLYYIRAFATNSEGTAYNQQSDFNTLELNPVVTGFSPTKIGNGTTETFEISGVDLPASLSLWIDGIMTGEEVPTSYSTTLVTFTVEVPFSYSLGGNTSYQIKPEFNSETILRSGEISVGTIIPSVSSFTPTTVIRGQQVTFELVGESLAQSIFLWIDGILPETEVLVNYSRSQINYTLQIPDEEAIVGIRNYEVKPTSESSQVLFSGTITVENNIPVVSTTTISDITSSTASSGGNVTFNGGSEITTRGVCWNTTGNPTISDSKTSDGSGVGAFTSNLTGLAANTTYYVRAYATNDKATSYGDEVSFTTTNAEIVYGSFTDSRDGKTYKTVDIGEQTWMAENLAYLPSVSPHSSGEESMSYYYVYDYEGTDVVIAKATENFTTYGVLYNWLAATTGCPSGWHLPSDSEWEQLALYVNEQKGPYTKDGDYWYNVGFHLKTTYGWTSSGNGSDDFGFSGKPGGYRVYDYFGLVGSMGQWWSSTEVDSHHAYTRYLQSDPDSIFYRFSNFYKDYGFSVRCIKD